MDEGAGDDAVEVGEVFGFDDLWEVDVSEVVDGGGGALGFDCGEAVEIREDGEVDFW